MPRLARIGVVIAVTGLIGMNTSSALAKSPPVTCQQHARNGQCIVSVSAPGNGHGPPGNGGETPGPPTCSDHGQPVPCERPGLGYWDPDLGCYLALEDPQPPKSDPLWEGNTTGAIYMCTTWPPVTTGATEIWLPTTPAGTDPQTLALSAVKSLRLPQPSGDRSPSQSQRFDGSPFS